MAAAGKYLEDELQGARLHGHAQQGGRHVVGDNIVGKLKGKGGKNLLLISHMDTVYLKGMLAKAPFRVEGDKAYGPGIADDKGGNAVILHTLKLLKARGFQDFGTHHGAVQHRRGEGLLRFARPDPGRGRQADYVLSSSPPRREARRPVARHLRHRLRAGQHQGQGLAAGAAPELGVNALVEASDLVLRTMDIDNKAKDLRFNWTIAQGRRCLQHHPRQRHAQRRRALCDATRTSRPR